MNIRGKLTLQFLLIVSLIFIVASLTIYGFSSGNRKEVFYERLLSKANNTAKLYVDVDEVDSTLLQKIEKDNPGSLPNERITIYNNQNKILFSTDEAGILKTNPQLLDRVRTEGEIRFGQDEYEIVGFMFEGTNHTFPVLAGAVDIYGFRKLKNLATVLLFVNAISFILVFFSGWFFSGQALSPISNVMNQVDRISINRLNLRVSEGNGTDEIARLAKTFNRMLERLESAFKVQKNFIANASHELRTPLTAMTGELEVNLMHDRTNDEYRYTLLSVLDDMKNLNSLSNRLLLLAQTSSENVEVNFVPIRVDDLLWQIKSELQKRSPEYKIHISFDGILTDDKMLTVSGSEQLLKTALTNLADNSCKYSADHEVWMKLHFIDERIVIRFIDKGIGIETDDLKQIFEPFYRGKNALSLKGHGIGLSLVKSIISMHHGTVVAESSPEETVFKVSFPTIS